MCSLPRGASPLRESWASCQCKAACQGPGRLSGAKSKVGLSTAALSSMSSHPAEPVIKFRNYTPSDARLTGGKPGGGAAGGAAGGAGAGAASARAPSTSVSSAQPRPDPVAVIIAPQPAPSAVMAAREAAERAELQALPISVRGGGGGGWCWCAQERVLSCARVTREQRESCSRAAHVQLLQRKRHSREPRATLAAHLCAMCTPLPSAYLLTLLTLLPTPSGRQRHHRTQAPKLGPQTRRGGAAGAAGAAHLRCD